MRPKFVREKTDDPDSITEVFDDKVYDPKWFTLDKNSVKTIIDIGSLIGAFTLWAHQSFPNASIYTYEPNPDSFELLCKNIDLLENNKGRIHPFNCAVWSENSIMTLYRSKDNTGGSSIVFDPTIYFESSKEESVNVKTQSITDIIDSISKPIDIMKLDCEGAEYEILFSLDKSKLNSIQHIVMEFHNPYNEESKVKDLVKYLRENGFIVQVPLDMNVLGYIYAKKSNISKNDAAVINQLIDNIVSISNERYSSFANRKSVKLGIKISTYLALLKNKLK